jgi:hypothetical protein
MGVADNLAPLFGAGPPGVRFRQGTILTWNANTGENTVDLAGGVLTNVPILNTGEAVALKAGHVVGLLGQGTSWFIVGRVTPPNDPNFAGASVAFGGANGFAQNFGLSTTLTAIASASIPVPSWADEAIVLATASATVVNTRGVADSAILFAQIAVNASNPIEQNTGTIAAAGTSNVSNAYQITTSDPADLAFPIQVSAQMSSTGAAWAASGNNRVTISAIAVFRSLT